MPINIQIKSLLFSLFIGWLYGFFYSIYELFPKKVPYFIHCIFEVIIQLILIYIVYIGLFLVNNGNINIYEILLFIIGKKVYYWYYLSNSRKIVNILLKYLSPIMIVYLKIFDIIKKQYGRRYKKHGKRKNHKKEKN